MTRPTKLHDGTLCQHVELTDYGTKINCRRAAKYSWRGYDLCPRHTPIGYRQRKHRIDLPTQN